MAQVSRREFLKGSTAAAGVLAHSRLTVASEQVQGKRSATDWVTLGHSGVKVTRLAFGTGTNGGRVQRELEQKKFTRLVRHAYDQGIRFFESADNYQGMHEMLAEALKGIPRDSYKLMTKMRWSDTKDVPATIDRFRKELNSDYFDIVLLHCVTKSTWPSDLERLRDGLSELKDKKVLLAHGASCHGLKPLRAFPGTKWLDVSLHRINHNGTKMDGPTGQWNEQGNVNEVVSNLKKIHAQGTGVLGMKLIGNGLFTSAEDREKSIRFVMNLGCVDAVTIGFKTPAEIDEAIERINRNLNA